MLICFFTFASCKIDKTEPKITTFSLESFIVNLADEDIEIFLRVTMDLGLNNNVVSEVDEKLTEIRDSILTFLTAQKLKDVSTVQGKANIKDKQLN